ncbi:sensor histidine kinase [Paraliobacillus sp. JSM ZJ581]
MISSVNELAEKFRLRSNIQLDVYQSNMNQPIQYKEIELIMYRIVQELLTNAIKHSQANKVELNLNYNERNFTITYTDDGVGIDKLIQKHNNFGLANMKELVFSFGGSFKMETNKGLQIMIEIPDSIERELIG